MKRVSYTAGGRLYPTIKNPMSNSLGVLQNGRQTKKRAGNPGLKLDQLFTSHVVMRDSHKSNHLPCHCCSIFVRPESLFVTGSCSKWHRNGAQSISRHNSNLHVLKQNLVITLRWAACGWKSKKKKPSLSYHRNQTLHAIQLRWFIKFLYINKKGDNNTMYSIVITIIVITIINEGNCVII